MQLQSDFAFAKSLSDVLFGFSKTERDAVDPGVDSIVDAANDDIVEIALFQRGLDLWLEFLLDVSVQDLTRATFFVNPAPAHDAPCRLRIRQSDTCIAV